MGATDAGTTIGEDLIQEIVRRILTVADPEKIILFGSAATGNMTRDSDIDLLVVESEIADYDVTVRAPANVTVASSASQVTRTAGAWVMHAEDMRDFALGIAANVQTLTRKVDNVVITVYHQPGHADGAKVSLDTAEAAMRWYSKKLGPYPFATLAIVEVPGGGQHNAQEHAGLFFIRSDFFTPLLAGEYTAPPAQGPMINDIWGTTPEAITLRWNTSA